MTTALTPDVPAPTVSPTEGDPARQAYDEYATTVAAAGGATLVPYETAAAESTQYALDRTRQAELMYTPTPFGPLPFPGTRLSDEELIERGWPRILDSGKRNEDYHTTAIWLDKAYVDAEIFSKYQALFELLAFRDGPPGEDFEARLGELMLPSVDVSAELNEAVVAFFTNRELGACNYEPTLKNVVSFSESGGYVRVLSDRLGRSLFWRYIEEVAAPKQDFEDRAIVFDVAGSYYLPLTVLYRNTTSPGSWNTMTVQFEARAVSEDRVMYSWQAGYNSVGSSASFVAVWPAGGDSWRVYLFASPYCQGYYPDTVGPR